MIACLQHKNRVKNLTGEILEIHSITFQEKLLNLAQICSTCMERRIGEISRVSKYFRPGAQPISPGAQQSLVTMVRQ